MTKLFLRHPVSTWMLFGGFVVMGLYALPKLKIEAIPEVDLPSLSITSSWNGASPQAIQRSLTLPIEEAARQVHGVESVKSTSRPGRSSVEVEFRRGTNLEFARLDLNEQLGSVRRNLPLNATQPQVLPYIPQEFQSEQFFTASIESPLGSNELRERAETWILPRVTAIEGVADAEIRGGSRALLKILLDRDKLELYNLNLGEILQAVGEIDALSAAGVVKENGYEKILSLREPLNLERLATAEVTRRGNRIFRLGEIAEISPSFEDPMYIVRSNGNSVVTLNVEKRSGANSVAVSKAIREALPEIEATLPFAAKFLVDEDEGANLEKKLWELVYRSLAILGLLFLLMAISLRQVKLTAIVTGSIFFAVLISLSLFYFLKLSVNFITISGLTVSFGLLLDNSILVLDGIHRRYEKLKQGDLEKLTYRAKLAVVTRSIQAGTSEVTFPILATTLTTLVAFGAFIFLSGRLSLYYVPLAVSVATALCASLFVAFGWIPVVLRQAWAAPLVKKMRDGDQELGSEGEIEGYVEDLPDPARRLSVFERAMIWTQRLWWLILPPTIAVILWGFLSVYPDKVIKGGFWRLPDLERLTLYLEMPPGMDLEYTAAIMQQFEDKLTPIPDGARMSATTFNGNQAYMSIEFSDSLRLTEIPLYYRELLVQQADITGGSSIVISGFSDTPYIKGAFGGSMLNSMVKLSGYNYKTLNDIAETAKARLSRNRRVRKARITSGQRFDRMEQDETVIAIDRNALAERGLSVSDLVQQLRLLLGVDIPWTLRVEGKEERAQLAYAGASEMEYTDLVAKLIRAPGGERVRLSDLIHVETLPTSGSVIREDQRYAVFLNWEYVGTDRMRKATIKQTLDELELPYGYFAEEGEREFFTEEEEEEILLMKILAAAFIFIVLASLFESIYLPLLVLTSLPMALLGVYLVFWLSRESFDSSAQIGLILLFGIVVNNAILLVSSYRHESAQFLKVRLGGEPCARASIFAGLRKQLGGSDLRRLPRGEAVQLLRCAVAQGTQVRLRSIVLTSLTTIVGLAPLLIHFGESEGRDIWENLALSSIGGLASSTVLLLLAMPPLYYFCVRAGWLLLDFGGWLRRRFSGAQPA